MYAIRVSVIFFVALILNTAALAGPFDNCQEFIRYGLPGNDGDMLCRKGFALAHSPDRKTPIWLIERLTRERAQGPVERMKNFRGDPELKTGARAVDSDYTNSGWTRGHVAPAGNMQWDILAMHQSFYLSNVVPQHDSMNKGKWSQLEELVRDWALVRGEVYVMTGPVYGANAQTIGKNKVAVPSHVYKIVFDPLRVEVIAFMFANEPTGSKTLADFLVSVREVEQLTGLDFLSNIAADVQAVIELKKATAVWE